MSDNGLEDDLFGGSDSGAPPQPPSPIASSSRGSPKPSGTASPAKQEDEGVADLFGDDDDDAPPSPTRGRAATTPDTPISHSSQSQAQTPNPLEYPEEDVQDPGQQEATWATVAFPKWEGLKPTDGKIWQMRLPAYMNFESTPYDPTLYRAGLDTPPEDEDVNLKRSRMIQVRNTIRWKWSTGDDGKPKRQSNARLLRWSDGTVSMQLGSDLYDLAPSYGTTLARKDDPPPKNPLPTDAPGADSTFIVHANDESGIMMTENTIAGHLSLVPASSSSKTHIELVKHVGQQHVKHSRMKVLDDIVDPEKAFTVQTNKKKTTNKRQAGGGGGGRSGGSRKKRGSSDEDDDDPRYTFDTDLPAGGRGGRGATKGRHEAEYDEEDGFVVADSDDEDAIEDDQDEEGDDAAYGSSSKKSKKKGSKGKKRKGEVEDEMDEMEEADRKIEALEREKKRAKREKRKSRPRYDTDEDDEPVVVDGGGGDADGEEDMEMDVESD